MIFLLWLLAAMSSCAQSGSWQVSHLQTGSSKYDSSRLYFPAADAISGIDVEMIRSDSEIFVYLLVQNYEIEPYQDNPKEAIVRLMFDDQTIDAVCHRHEGGQRLFLPDSLKQPLLSALQEEKDVTLQLAGFRSTISGRGFPSSFAALLKTPLRNPLQPPIPL